MHVNRDLESQSKIKDENGGNKKTSKKKIDPMKLKKVLNQKQFGEMPPPLYATVDKNDEMPLIEVGGMVPQRGSPQQHPQKATKLFQPKLPMKIKTPALAHQALNSRKLQLSDMFGGRASRNNGFTNASSTLPAPGLVTRRGTQQPPIKVEHMGDES